MGFKNVSCAVEGLPDPFGEFANALRLVEDGSEVLIDFCLYSQADNVARVVSRVRVSQDFLEVIQKKIAGAFQQQPEEEDVLYVVPSTSIEA